MNSLPNIQTQLRNCNMAGESKKTRDHAVIQKWVEERGGQPAIVKDTKSGKSGVIRITFPKYNKPPSLVETSWDEFLRIFDENGLTFLYQEKTKDGKTSRFFKFIKV
jgi:hypothetical protein